MSNCTSTDQLADAQSLFTTFLYISGVLSLLLLCWSSGVRAQRCREILYKRSQAVAPKPANCCRKWISTPVITSLCTARLSKVALTHTCCFYTLVTLALSQNIMALGGFEGFMPTSSPWRMLVVALFFTIEFCAILVAIGSRSLLSQLLALFWCSLQILYMYPRIFLLNCGLKHVSATWYLNAAQLVILVANGLFFAYAALLSCMRYVGAWKTRSCRMRFVELFSEPLFDPHALLDIGAEDHGAQVWRKRVMKSHPYIRETASILKLHAQYRPRVPAQLVVTSVVCVVVVGWLFVMLLIYFDGTYKALSFVDPNIVDKLDTLGIPVEYISVMVRSTEAVYPCFMTSRVVALVSTYYSIYRQYISFFTHLQEFRRGIRTTLPTSHTLSASSIIRYSCGFQPFSVVSNLVGFIFQATGFFILLWLLVCVFVVPVIVFGPAAFWIKFILNQLPYISFLVISATISYILSRYVFTAVPSRLRDANIHQGWRNSALIRNRRGLELWCFFLWSISFAVGILVIIKHFLLVFFISFLLLCRRDISMFPTNVVWLDPGHSAYISFLRMTHENTNPSMIAFCQILLLSTQAGEKYRLRVLLEHKGQLDWSAHNNDTLSDVPRTRAWHRWRLSTLLVNNPALIDHRKWIYAARRQKILREEKKASVVGEP